MEDGPPPLLLSTIFLFLVKDFWGATEGLGIEDDV